MNRLKKLSILSLVLLSACGNNDDDKQAVLTNYSATNANEHAIIADGEELTYENIDVSKTGDGRWR